MEVNFIVQKEHQNEEEEGESDGLARNNTDK